MRRIAGSLQVYRPEVIEPAFSIWCGGLVGKREAEVGAPECVPARADRSVHFVRAVAASSESWVPSNEAPLEGL